MSPLISAILLPESQFCKPFSFFHLLRKFYSQKYGGETEVYENVSVNIHTVYLLTVEFQL